MRLTCTACGAHGSVEQFVADAEARTVLDRISRLPAGLPAVAVRYLGLFRPIKRGLTWDRADRISSELIAMIEAGAVTRSGKSYPASPDTFRNAMQQMLDMRERLELPLTSHAYLATILAKEGPREAAAAEAAAENAKRQQTRSGAAETDEQRMQRMRREQEEADRRWQLQQQVAAAMRKAKP